jgi:hypothetical protein
VRNLHDDGVKDAFRYFLYDCCSIEEIDRKWLKFLDKHNVIDKESGGGKGNTTSGDENRKRGRGRPRRIDQTHPVTKIVVDQFSTEYMTKRAKLARGADRRVINRGPYNGSPWKK